MKILPSEIDKRVLTKPELNNSAFRAEAPYLLVCVVSPWRGELQRRLDFAASYKIEK